MTPEQQLADARERLANLQAKGRPPDVIARYEAEVRRLEAWIALGAPISPASVSFSTLKPLTQRTLIFALAQDTKGDDPEMAELVRIAQDEHVDEATRLAAMHRIADLADVRTVMTADNPATVSLEWPGGVGVLQYLAETIARTLIPTRDGEPLGPQARADQQALAVFLGHPPVTLHPQHWTPKLACYFLALVGLEEAMKLHSSTQWTGRVGVHDGSKMVTDIPVEAGALGYAKWLQQEAPEFARRWLRDYAVNITDDPGRRDFRPEQETDWPTVETGPLDLADPRAQADMERAADGDDEEARDQRIVRLGRVLPHATPLERQVLLAESRPERLWLLEPAAELAGQPLTAGERRRLATVCRSDAEIAELIGSSPASVRNARKSFKRKMAAL